MHKTFAKVVVSTALIIGGFVPSIFSASLTRGPYLQSCTSTSIVVRWRTDTETDSRVRYRASDQVVERTSSDGSFVTEHEIRINGLTPDTLYSYCIHSGAGMLAGGPDFYFRTHATNTRPVRVWAIGDAGDGSTNQIAVRDAYLNLPNSEFTDVWLMLGDNVYEYGGDDEYQLKMFDVYAPVMRRTVFWPAMGNHDAPYGSPAQYTSIFTLPTRGEAGGVPSQTELYYSFNHANVHFVCLDSWLSDRSANGPMLQWLRADLAAATQDWIIVFWHHPPYSMGTDFSDSRPILIQMREVVVPILESYGVDLVLCGHSHVYERSLLLNGHYGYSWTLHSDNILDAGLGRTDHTGPYRKKPGRLGANGGTVYTVCGNSGVGGPVQFLRHPAMAANLNGYGSIVLDINGLQLDAKYLRAGSGVDDYFTIDKTLPATGPRLFLTRSNGWLTVSWQTLPLDFALEKSADPSNTNSWQLVRETPAAIGSTRQVTFAVSNSPCFFRLRSVP